MFKSVYTTMHSSIERNLLLYIGTRKVGFDLTLRYKWHKPLNGEREKLVGVRGFEPPTPDTPCPPAR